MENALSEAITPPGIGTGINELFSAARSIDARLATLFSKSNKSAKIPALILGFLREQSKSLTPKEIAREIAREKGLPLNDRKLYVQTFAECRRLAAEGRLIQSRCPLGKKTFRIP